MPWLRLDALALNIVWVMPTFTRTMPRTVGTAWKLAGCFIPISFGWAAGDVSLAAYIQSTLTAMNIKSKDVSPLGAVMAFLFSSYVVLNAGDYYASQGREIVDEADLIYTTSPLVDARQGHRQGLCCQWQHLQVSPAGLVKLSGRALPSRANSFPPLQSAASSSPSLRSLFFSRL